jgi:hypothetical protein
MILWLIQLRKLFWGPHPLRITMLARSFYLIQSTDNITATLRQRQLSSFLHHQFPICYILNSRRQLCRLTATTIRALTQFLTQTAINVKARNRVEFLTSSSAQRFLLGPGPARCSRGFKAIWQSAYNLSTLELTGSHGITSLI